MTTDPLSSFEVCTTPSRRRCHLARAASLTPIEQGRRGATLCGHYAIDEDWANADRHHRRVVVVVALPPCQLCIRAARARTAAAGTALAES
jgi:hypothetical protein